MKNEIVAFIKSLRLLVINPEDFFLVLMKHTYERDAFLRTTYYPLLGLFSLLVFFTKSFSVTLIEAVKGAVAVAFPYFAALFVCDYLIRLAAKKVLKRELVAEHLFQIITYCLSVMMLVGIVSTTIPFFFFIKLLYLYVYYLFFVACRVTLDVDVEKHFWFFFIASSLIIVVPSALEMLVKLF